MNTSETQNAVENVEVKKVSFRRVELSLNQIINVAIPMHVEQLKVHSANITNFQLNEKEIHLLSEQIGARKAVQWLKADLRDLEGLYSQIRDEDLELFQNKVSTPTRNIIEVLSDFMELYTDALEPFPNLESVSMLSVSPLVCQCDEVNSQYGQDKQVLSANQGQIQEFSDPRIDIEHRWSLLKKELLEVNALIHKFASYIFLQQSSVDQIQDNILNAHENVQIGTKHLKKATVLQAAAFPVAGAIIGGLFLGPIGAFVGFKLMGSVACATVGSIAGSIAGSKLKNRRQQSCDMELKALTYTSKLRSHSNPELTTDSNLKKLN